MEKEHFIIFELVFKKNNMKKKNVFNSSFDKQSPAKKKVLCLLRQNISHYLF